MFVHSVFFWLKPEVSDVQRREFLDRVQAMSLIPGVRALYVAPPASTRRPVIDHTYSYALHVVFDDLQGHDTYQAHKLHDEFRDHCAKLWNKVVIYDCQG